MTYDTEALAFLGGVFEDSWQELVRTLGLTPSDASGLRDVMAKRIMTAANAGERNPLRLKLLALGGIEA